jgi:hypothetical protein
MAACKLAARKNTQAKVTRANVMIILKNIFE